MQIVLIEPSTGEKKITSFKYPPMGLLALGAYIKEKGFEVKLIDASIDNLSIQQIVEKVTSDCIVGISSMSVNINASFAIARALKAKNSAIKVILGGIHPTVMPEHVLSEPCVDLVVMGEGELTFGEILEGRRFGEIEGIAFRNGEQIIINKRRGLIKDLDTLPIPLYSLLDISKYKSPYARRTPFISMVRSRGCPFECTFCGNPKMFGRTFRCQSPERTIQEIDFLINAFGIKEISFKDTELTLDKNLPILLGYLIYKNYDLIWSCNGRVNNVNEKLLIKMKQAGCYAITFGIESGNPEILKKMKKQITLQQSIDAVKLAKKIGLQVVTNFMIGNAWDTKETIEQTISFSKELNPDYAYFGFATPFPGTELRIQAETNHWILDNSMDAIRYDDCMMNATNLPLEELKPYLKKAYNSFYFRPSFILKKIFNFSEYPNYIEGLKKLL
jgi:anaerobic magnesium-protoporphyrin IX monomethyl ester cyclase